MSVTPTSVMISAIFLYEYLLGPHALFLPLKGECEIDIQFVWVFSYWVLLPVKSRIPLSSQRKILIHVA
jgi:hypothetical protein